MIGLGILLVVLINVTAAGHNNDKGMYKLSGRKEMFELLNVLGLCDRGYSNNQLIRPDDPNVSLSLNVSVEEFSYIQAKYRSLVENLFAVIKLFSYAGTKAKDTPEVQALNLVTIYSLSKLKLSA